MFMCGVSNVRSEMKQSFRRRCLLVLALHASCTGYYDGGLVRAFQPVIPKSSLPNGIKDRPASALEGTSRDASNDVSKGVSKGVPKGVPLAVPREVPSEVPREVPTETSNTLASNQRGQEKKDKSQASQYKQRKGPKKSPSLKSQLYRIRHQENGAELCRDHLLKAVKSMLETAEQHRSTGDGSFVYDGRNSDHKNFPDLVTFHLVILEYSKMANNDPLAAQQAETLLLQMEDLSKQYPHLQTTIFGYNSVLQAFAKSYNSPRRNFQQKRQQYLSSILRFYGHLKSRDDLQQTCFTYNILLSLPEPNLAEWKEAEAWCLRGGDKQVLGNDDQACVPDRQTYNSLFQVYATVGNADSSERLLRTLVRKYMQLNDDGGAIDDSEVGGHQHCVPNTAWFNRVYAALAFVARDKSRQNAASTRAEALFAMQKTLYRHRFNYVRPDANTYNQLLLVFARAGQSEKAVQLLEEHEQAASKRHGDLTILPDRIAYSTVLQAFAKQQDKLAAMGRAYQNVASEQADKAMEIYNRMIELGQAGRPNMTPSVITYNILINVLSSIGTRAGLYRATNVLKEMKDDPTVTPESSSYITLIYAWSKCSRTTRLREAGYRAEQLLNELNQLPPNQAMPFRWTPVVNAIISAWARSEQKNAPARVEKLLELLEQKFLNGRKDACPDTATFIGVMDAYAKAGVEDSAARCDAMLNRMQYLRETYQIPSLKPNRPIWNAVINALAKSAQPDSIEKAEEILTMMQSASREVLQPDIVTYSTIIDCHTKSGGGPARAVELLRYVEGSYRNGNKMLKPNAVFYSAILQSWAKTATEDGAKKSEELLRRNIGLYEGGIEYAKPTTIMYNAVIDAVARARGNNAGDKAEELLTEMENLYESGNQDMKPSRRTFDAVILAYRGQINGGVRAETMLSKMERFSESNEEVTPDVVTYNCVIGAIVDDPNDEGAADRAQALLDRMKQRSIRADGRTYSCVIEAWLKRNDEKGRALAEQMLGEFLEEIEENTNVTGTLYEEEVWKVVSDYKLLGAESAIDSSSFGTFLPDF